MSLILILVGIGWALIEGGIEPGTTAVMGPSALFHLQALLSPHGALNLGLLILLATPVGGLILVAVGFLAERDWRYVLVTLLVLAVMLVGIVNPF